MFSELFRFWELKFLIVFISIIPSINVINDVWPEYTHILYVLPIMYWIVASITLNKVKNEFFNKKERLIIFGLYSKSVKGYLSYYLDENDAIKQLEKRNNNLEIDYQRGVLLNKKGDVVFSVHPIVVIK